jgi:hypothetical protein
VLCYPQVALDEEESYNRKFVVRDSVRLQKHPDSVTLVTLFVWKINENAIEVYKHIKFKELSPVVKKEFTKSLEYSAEQYTAMAKLRTKYFEEIGGDLENIQHMLLVLIGYHAVRLKVPKKKNPIY